MTPGLSTASGYTGYSGPAFQLESISMLLDPGQVRHWSGIRQQVIAELGLPVHRAANDALILHKTWERVICRGEAAVQ